LVEVMTQVAGVAVSESDPRGGCRSCPPSATRAQRPHL